MSEHALRRYFELEEKLFDIREKNNWEESGEEDDVLDEMDVEYYALTADEIKELEKPRTKPELVKKIEAFRNHLKER